MLMRTASPSSRRQRGFTLMEVLVSVLILSLGILALVKLQASAAKMATDARQRAEATFLADQLIARMMISDPATAGTFAHYGTGTVKCAPEGAASTNTKVVEWLRQVADTFPNAAADDQQIVVSGTDVTVRLCWKNGATDDVHTLEVINRVQWP
jgi:type IV pilus assembly protein PilV